MVRDAARGRGVDRAGRGGGAGLHQSVRPRRLAARRASEGGGSGLRLRAGVARGPPRAGGVRERESHGAAHARARPQRRDRGRAGAAPVVRGLGRRARVLLQRRRRADGPLRRVGGGALPPGGRARCRGARGRLPRGVHRGPRRATSWRPRVRAWRTSRPTSASSVSATRVSGASSTGSDPRSTGSASRFDVYFSERDLQETGRDRRRGAAAPGSRLPRTKPTARCGSAPPSSVTTRTGS